MCIVPGDMQEDRQTLAEAYAETQIDRHALNRLHRSHIGSE